MRIEYYREGIAEITDKLIHAYQIYAIEGTREGRKIFWETMPRKHWHLLRESCDTEAAITGWGAVCRDKVEVLLMCDRTGACPVVCFGLWQKLIW